VRVSTSSPSPDVTAGNEPPASLVRHKVLVVDDHSIVRRGLATLINEHQDLQVIGEAANESEAIFAFRQERPDILVVDWSLKQRDSGPLIVALLREQPSLPVLVVSVHDEVTHADLAIELGARGYIMKREAAEKIIDGIRVVLSGRFFLSSRAVNSLSPSASNIVNELTVISGPWKPEITIDQREAYTRWSVSVVIPVYNSERTIPRLCAELSAELSNVESLQIVLVDDGSTDQSAMVCAEMHERYPYTVEFIELARNFGEHNAVLAGLKHAVGEYCVIMDDDLQNPPSEIPKLLRHASLGFEVVYSKYEKRRHPLYRRVGSAIHNCTARLAIESPAGLYLSSFKVLSKTVVKQVIKYDGPKPYLDALILSTSASIGSIECAHHHRASGLSGYSLIKLVGLWCRLAFGFSVWPLHAGITTWIIAFAALGVTHFANGFAEFSKVAVFSLIGATGLLIGIIGEYAGRLYMRRNGAPQYVIRRRTHRATVSLTCYQTSHQGYDRHAVV
jgi:DNA-binding NarL/FixJ family response regulator/glycosyltransferase involved in cell wall biosynthesis